MQSPPDRFGQSARLRRVQPPVIPRIHRLIAENPGTISLGQGVVGYPPPPGVRAALDRFLADADNHKYASVYGIPALRERIAAKLSRENGIAVDDEHELMVTAGGNMAFVNALLAICDEGAEVVLMSPYYFNHEMAVTMAGCRPVLVETGRDFQLDLDAVEAAVTANTRAVVTISPNNPSGAVYPRADLCALNRLCAERGLFHVHDEAYEYFLHDGAEHFSPGSLPDAGDHTISLYSLSKAYGLASWRIGYLRMPAYLHDAAAKIQDTIAICPAIISQFAAVAALDAGVDYCRGQLAAISARRSAVLRTLGALRPLVEGAGDPRRLLRAGPRGDRRRLGSDRVAADLRTPRSGRAGHGVRADRRLLPAHRVRRTRRRHPCGGVAPARRGACAASYSPAP